VTAHVKFAGPANSKSTRRAGAPRPSRRAPQARFEN
jgi:hypothetical protein